MKRIPRMHAFRLDTERFEGDPVVIAMSALARAFYARLLIRLWRVPEPGVVPDDDRVLRGLCEAGDLWPQVASDIRTAFDATTRPGHLIQWGTVRTHAEQTRWHESAQRRGSQGGEASAKARKARRERRLKQRLSGGQAEVEQTQPGSGFRVQGSVTPEQEDFPGGAVRSGAPSAKPVRSTRSKRLTVVAGLAVQPGSGAQAGGQAGFGEIEAVAPPQEAVAVLPCVAGPDWPVMPAKVEEWRLAFPAVDVVGEVRQMRAWLLANRSRRPTARGVERFVVRWLAREQDKGGHGGTAGVTAPQPPAPPKRPGALERLRDEERRIVPAEPHVVSAAVREMMDQIEGRRR